MVLIDNGWMINEKEALNKSATVNGWRMFCLNKKVVQNLALLKKNWMRWDNLLNCKKERTILKRYHGKRGKAIQKKGTANVPREQIAFGGSKICRRPV